MNDNSNRFQSCMRRSLGLLLILLTATSVSLAEHSVARQWNDEILDAIRIDIPKPTVHARNLFHSSIAMWDAWAAYDNKALGYLVTEKHQAEDVEAARNEAISYAVYRVLKHRYRYGPGEETSQAEFDALMDASGYDKTFTSTDGNSPAALGNRIAQTIIDYGLSDGANEGPFLDYADDTGYFPVNPELVFDLPGTVMIHPNRWQPLAFDYLILQNGIVIGQAIQTFLSPNWGKVASFALKPEDQNFPWVHLDPGPPPMLGGPGDAEIKANAVQNILFSSYVDPADGVTIDISPAVFHNNPLGTQDGTGYPVNPFTGEPYEPNVVKRADYARVLAEFWADGPHSETPPGHWNTLANYVSDHPMVVKRMGGRGPVLDDLEWDVKTYFSINGAVHDAAIAAWGAKGYYDYSRPISHIRYMGDRGQSSDPDGPSYHEDGLPLVDNLIEVITAATTQAGERHEHLAGYEGDIAVRSWKGNPENPETEVGGVGWIRAVEWMPYQRDTFVTPPFAGYISGHSTFSRAAAEVLTAMTGSPYFPGGLGKFVAEQDEYLEFEAGPTETLELRWATYYDAADEAGISRLYGGIHPAADDFPARIVGSLIGQKAWAEAKMYFDPGRVDICHRARRTITVAHEAAAAHLRHGDTMGACPEPGDGESTAQGTPGPVGHHDVRRVSRDALLRVLETSADIEMQLTAARGLVGRGDVTLDGTLEVHLRLIQADAEASGRRDLARQASRLRARISRR